MLPRKFQVLPTSNLTDSNPCEDQGQGGGQAIEDAGALSVLFSNLPSKDFIRHRLQIYRDVRKNRAASIQVLSNAGQDEAAKVEAEARKYMGGRPVPSKSNQVNVVPLALSLLTISTRLIRKSTRISRIQFRV